jgi:tRNA pseudouridine13 synthase
MLKELTAVPARNPETNVLTLDDPELMKFPVAYLTEPGSWFPNNAEVIGLRNYLAKPSPLDRSDDAKVKEHWRRHWGDWGRRIPLEAAHRYDRVLRSLREKPTDYLRAFLQIDANYRALQLFTYQSWLWNEGVRRLLQLSLPREALFPVRYQAGTLLFHQEADPESLRWLQGLSFPLLAPDSRMEEPRVAEAVAWVLGKEKLKLEQLRIAGAERLLYFRHEERPVLVQPSKLVLGRTQPDEFNRGSRSSTSPSPFPRELRHPGGEAALPRHPPRGLGGGDPGIAAGPHRRRGGPVPAGRRLRGSSAPHPPPAQSRERPPPTPPPKDLAAFAPAQPKTGP